MSYVDLHCHLLPGVDDGARSWEDSLAYAKRMRQEGVRDVLVTPHVNRIWALDPLSIPERVAELDDRLRRAGARLRLHAGAEVAHHRVADLATRELKALAVGPADAPWVLLEAPFEGVDDGFLRAACELRARRLGLVIAHPERSPDIATGGLERLRPLLAEGAVLQVNVCSLLGNHGLAAQEAAVRLLRSGLAYVLSSDAHPGTRDHTRPRRSGPSPGRSTTASPNQEVGPPCRLVPSSSPCSSPSPLSWR